MMQFDIIIEIIVADTFRVRSSIKGRLLTSSVDIDQGIH